MPEIYNATAEPKSAAVATPPVKKRLPTDYSEILRNNVANPHPLSAFRIRPPQVCMGILEENEIVLLLVRKHCVTNLKWLLLVAGMALIPLVARVAPSTFLPGRFVVATTFLWYLLTLGISLNGFLSWFYNISIITDERIIDIDFANLVYKNVSTAKIDNIEDVTVQMGGAVRNMFDFGTVKIQTAAETNEFEFEDIPHPQQVAKLLNELMLEEEQEQLEGRAR